MGERTTITTTDGTFGAYVARPAAATAPAVVVIQEIFGVNQVMRDITDGLARPGLPGHLPGPVLADRAGHRHHRPVRGRVEAGLRAVQRLRRRARASRTSPPPSPHIRTDPGCSGKVGAVGFCLGGLLAFLTATRTDADAAVSYYGVGIENRVAEAEKLTHPLLMHIAEEDQFVPKPAQAVILAALKDHPQVEIHTYPGCDHAFAREGGEHFDAGGRQARQRPHPAVLQKDARLMRAIRFEQTGGPEVLELVEVETPTPGPGQILVRHEAIGINFIDTYQRSGLYPMKLPSGLGVGGGRRGRGGGRGRHPLQGRRPRRPMPAAPGAYADANVVAGGPGGEACPAGVDAADRRRRPAEGHDRRVPAPPAAPRCRPARRSWSTPPPAGSARSWCSGPRPWAPW